MVGIVSKILDAGEYSIMVSAKSEHSTFRSMNYVDHVWHKVINHLYTKDYSVFYFKENIKDIFQKEGTCIVANHPRFTTDDVIMETLVTTNYEQQNKKT